MRLHFILHRVESLKQQPDIEMTEEKIKTIQKVITFLRNRMMAANKHSYEQVLTLCKEQGILLEEVLNYWHNEAFNV
jgi:hypothetical protein